jgi:inosine-uridine nucleoside N-ribohydrolase
MTQKIIIDTDPGIDDAMAIQLAFAHPGVEVLGLTTVFGNVHVDKATRNALRLIELAGADCPVAEGAAVPLVRPPEPPGYYVHGDEGFGDHPAETPRGGAHELDAADFIIATLSAHPREVTLVPIGPLTNIATALARDPTITAKVRGVVVMGGAIERRGNVTEWAEANIWHDPHAAAVVLAADWPVTLVGLDVTERTLCAPMDMARIADHAPLIGGFLDRAAQFYFGWHRGKGVHEGCFLHDPAAVLAVVEPALFGVRDVPVRVVTEGEEIGRTVADPVAGTPPVAVCTSVDARALHERFVSTLMTADACRAMRSG